MHLSAPETIEDTVIAHFGIRVEMRFMASFFDAAEYGENSMAFILRSSGGQIYRQEKKAPISRVWIIIGALVLLCIIIWIGSRSVKKQRESVQA